MTYIENEEIYRFVALLFLSVGQLSKQFRMENVCDIRRAFIYLNKKMMKSGNIQRIFLATRVLDFLQKTYSPPIRR